MLDTDIPTKFPAAWAWNATSPTYVRPIPVTSQIGINPGFASLPDGFPPLTFVPTGSGGVDPYGQDMNGILLQITQWCLWLTANPAQPYDATWQTAIGGYNKGAVVESAVTFGNYWLSTANNNTTNPDTGGSGWITWSPGGVNNYVVDTGAANALVVTPNPPVSAYTDGINLTVNPAHANTVASTINVSALGAVPIVHTDGSAITTGEIQAGWLMQIVFKGGSAIWLNAPYAVTRPLNDNSNFLATTAYADRAAASIDTYGGKLFGLTMSNTVSLTTTSITASVGACRDSTNTVNMAIASPFAKLLTSAWAAGTGNGGKLTGTALAAGQTWHFFIITKADGTTDFGYDQSPTAPTLPSGYLYFRRLGAIILEAASTNIRQFIQTGDYFELVTRSADYAVTANGSGVSYYRAITVPFGIRVLANLYFQSTGTSNDTNAYLSLVWDPALGAPPAFGGSTQWAQIRRLAAYLYPGTFTSYGTTMLTQWTDTTAHIYTFSNDNADVIALGVVGWTDQRGRLY